MGRFPVCIGKLLIPEPFLFGGRNGGMTWKTLSRLTLQVLRPAAACSAAATQVEPDSPPICRRH